jgi:hypothetical protein
MNKILVPIYWHAGMLTRPTKCVLEGALPPCDDSHMERENGEYGTEAMSPWGEARHSPKVDRGEMTDHAEHQAVAFHITARSIL